MNREISRIGPTELAVLRFVADNAPTSVREVADHMEQVSGQARTTVLTLMERLRKKKLLTRRKLRGINRYSLKVPKSELLDSLVNRFIDEVLDGSVSPFLAHLLENDKLSESEIEELQRIVSELPTKKRSGS